MTTQLTDSYELGESVTYQKEIMFKGWEEVTAKVVAIRKHALLLDNGDWVLVR